MNQILYVASPSTLEYRESGKQVGMHNMLAPANISPLLFDSFVQPDRFSSLTLGRKERGLVNIV